MTKDVVCSGGYTAYFGSFSIQSVNGGGASDVTVHKLSTPDGHPDTQRFTIKVAAPVVPDDNSDGDDPDARVGTVKLFTTCVANSTSAGDVVKFDGLWQPNGTFDQIDYFNAQLPTNAGPTNGKTRRLLTDTAGPDAATAALTVDPGTTRTVFVGCPTATFGSHAIMGARRVGDNNEDGYTPQSEPRGNGWSFTLSNLSPDTTYQVSDWHLGITCLQSKTAKQRP